MELGLSLGETMADAGSDLVLGLGMGVGVRREEEAQRGRRELEFETGRCARPSPEPAVRLTLLPGLGLPWPLSSETNREVSTRGFDDVNRALSVAGAGAEEDEAAVAAATAAASSSPNNSSGSFAVDFSAQGQAAHGADRACSRASDEDDGGSARKKLRLSKEQSAFLEESFKVRATPNPKQKLALARQLNLRPRQVEVWFQNRRARTKLKQTEVDCEHLKRCCETLTGENRRLHKELAELRALKAVRPLLHMHLPATTLSMCPSCERVASTSSAAPAAPAPASPSPAAGIAASAPDPEQRRSSFAALFSSSPRNRALAAQAQRQRQPRPQAPAGS